MRFLFIPDSFKGTLSSVEVCAVLDSVSKEIFPNSSATSIPVADGGEGSVDVFLSLGLGEKRECVAHNSFMEQKTAYYLYNPQNKTAIVELAITSGLPEVYDRRNPTLTTTYGVGEVIGQAIDDGAKKIIVALGGSSTNDGGVGIACALGAKFFNAQGKEFLPVGGTLSDIESIDISGLNDKIKGVAFSVMCDVDTVLLGERGASAVYGPQKGANPAQVKSLDQGLSHLNDLFISTYNRDFSSIAGGGAAGGAGAGISAFLGGKLESGIKIVLKLTEFEKKAVDSDYVFTGEGKLDEQSFMGKVINGVSEKTQKLNKKLVVIAGVIKGVTDDEIKSHGICGAFATNPNNLPFEEVRARAREDLIITARKVFEKIKSGEI